MRLGPLLDPAGEPGPFIGVEDTGHKIEGDQAFRVAALAIDGEGDPDGAEDRLRLPRREARRSAP